MSFTYLASPYSSPNPLVREMRFRQACAAAKKLMAQGEKVFSPIAHSHPIDTHFDAPQPAHFWLDQDFAILRHASCVKVLKLHGWQDSKGIAQEVAFAQHANIPVEYINP